MRIRRRSRPLFATPRRRWRRPVTMLVWLVAFVLVGGALVATVDDLGPATTRVEADHPHPSDPDPSTVPHGDGSDGHP